MGEPVPFPSEISPWIWSRYGHAQQVLGAKATGPQPHETPAPLSPPCRVAAVGRSAGPPCDAVASPHKDLGSAAAQGHALNGSTAEPHGQTAVHHTWPNARKGSRQPFLQQAAFQG